ncbi:MAG: NAD(+)/NADH kinase [Oscillospiraceae bacterium]|nr:NAD(+)/NADH kinase [Oscillospiraceae bacterium]
MNFVIMPNLSKDAAIRTARDSALYLMEKGASVFMDPEVAPFFQDIEKIIYYPQQKLFSLADFVLAIGGDGTILRCACSILEYAEFTHSTPIKLVGINTGTLGFLAAFEASELSLLDCLLANKFSLSWRMLLQTTIIGSNGTEKYYHALNDIYASRMNGRICDFAVSVDDRKIGVYRADGIVFSTPTGSSAYALSAGGPVMEPDLMLIEMNLICPHSLFARPMLFAPHRTIRVTYCGDGDGGLNVHADGNHATILHNLQSFTVSRSSRMMPFVDCKGHTFYDALNGKLMQPLKDFPIRIPPEKPHKLKV